jgi:hypothetical protein
MIACGWTHNQCAVCWTCINPARPPVTVAEAETETCCYCGESNTDGIFVRADPETFGLMCGGTEG